MKPFTSIWKARVQALLAGVVFFGVYFATLNEGFFPGEAARQASIALKMEPGRSSTQVRQIEERASRTLSNNAAAISLGIRENVISFRSKYLLWRLVGESVAALPFGALSFRMNLLPAVCGGLAALFAYATCRTLLLLLSFHVCPLSARLRKKAATTSAVAGTVTLCASAPFWIASTRFLPQAFETLLMILAAWSLLCAAVRHREWPLIFFGILLGMLVFETETNVFLLPLWIFFAVRAMMVGDLADARGWTCFLVGFVVGAICYLGLAQFMLAREGLGVFVPVKEFIASTKVFRSLLLGGSLFEDQPRIVCLCFAIIPFLAAAAMSIWRSNEEAGSSGGFLLFVLACMVAVGCSSLQISPWGAYSNTDGARLPTTIYLMSAYVAAYLAGHGLLMAGGRFFTQTTRRRNKKQRQYLDEDDDDGNVRAEEHRDYPIGRILSAFIVIFAFAMAAWNYRTVKDWCDPMADKVSAAIVARLPPCTWFTSESGQLDSHIRIHARMAGQRVSVVCTADTENTLPRLAAAITRDDAFRGLATADLRSALVSTNTALFLSTWISMDPDIGKKLMTTDARDWEAASKPVIPAIAGYKTTDDESKIDWKAIAADHIAFWNELKALGPLGHHAPLWLRQDRAEIRENAYGVGRKLVDRLNAAAQKDLAREVLEAVESIREEPVAAAPQFSPYYTY